MTQEEKKKKKANAETEVAAISVVQRPSKGGRDGGRAKIREREANREVVES